MGTAAYTVHWEKFATRARAVGERDNSTGVDFEDPLGYEWTVVIDGVIVPLASHAVAGRVAHINWYYY